MRLFASSLLALVLLPSSTLALSPATELTRELDAVEPALAADLEDADTDAAELRLEASTEFFPDDGTELGDRQEVEGSDTYVTFRLGDVPYLLHDVPLTAWFAPYVRDMTERGIVTGYRSSQGIPTGVFGPERNVSLEELAKMSVEAAGLDRASCPGIPNNPVAEKSWSASYVACAESHAFAVYADGTVDVRRAATRAEVVMTVLQAFGAQVLELTDAEKIFTDVTPSTLFAGAIKTAVQGGIVSGYVDAQGKLTGQFGPSRPINRAEVSKILSIAIQVYKK